MIIFLSEFSQFFHNFVQKELKSQLSFLRSTKNFFNDFHKFVEIFNFFQRISLVTFYFFLSRRRLFSEGFINDFFDMMACE